MKQVYATLLLLLFWCLPLWSSAQSIDVATTTLTVSVCGNAIVDANEQCDAPGETGVYSQTIAGRQCTASCIFGPYCGDGILQIAHGEECDDGNNDDGDFCSSICKIEPAGSGGGGSSGGGSGGGGGRDTDLGDTLISIKGLGYPNRTINMLLDNRSVGTVRTGNDGSFEFTIGSSPGTATLGMWAIDAANTRSITLNTTFDVTQGAITNVNGIVLPPTIRVTKQNINPGESVTFSGQTIPNATINLYDGSNTTSLANTTANSTGAWSIVLNTSSLSVAEHIIKARSLTGTGGLRKESGYSSGLQLFVGVDGQVTRPSDLNRDGFVNLIDFSILIFWWQTNGGDSDPPADISQNGRVGLEDFSIMLFNWTG